jgi:ATP-dependent Clp protease adapter protein ClpS
MEEQKTNIKIRQVVDLQPPKDYKVIYINDNETTFEFVHGSLISIFNYDDQPATDKVAEINETGSGIVAILPFEIAEQKGCEVLMLARTRGYPLEVRLEQG